VSRRRKKRAATAFIHHPLMRKFQKQKMRIQWKEKREEHPSGEDGKKEDLGTPGANFRNRDPGTEMVGGRKGAGVLEYRVCRGETIHK